MKHVSEIEKQLQDSNMKTRTLSAALAAIISLLAAAVSAQVTVTTVAINYQNLPNDPGLPLNEPYGVVVDALGNFYVCDSANNRIVRVDASTQAASTLAGIAGEAGSNDGPPDQAHFNSPQGLLTVSIGGVSGLLVADSGNNLIRFVRFSDGVVTTLAGQTAGGPAVNAAGSSATFRSPIGLDQDANGNVYIADWGNNTIRVMNLNDLAFGITNVVISGTSFYRPKAVAFAGVNQLWVADTGNQMIKLITLTTPTSGSLTTYMGSYRLTGTTDASRGTNALFNSPSGLLWANGVGLLISDTLNNSIRLATHNPVYGATNYAVVTFAGTPGNAGLQDGSAATAKFNSPFGLAQDMYNGFLVADLKNNAIRRIQNGPPPPPAAPIILTVLTNFGQVSLTWSTPAGATTYNVKRSPNSGGPYTTTANTSATNYTDTGLLDGMTYFYVVSAIGVGGEGPNSAPRSATTPLPPVPDPEIGYVDFPPMFFFSVFHPVSSFVLNNDTPIVIVGTVGSQTFYTYGATGSSIPDPTSASASAPVGYQDGLSASEAALYTIAQQLPDLTIKAIGEKPDGSPNSAIVQARFQFITANPVIIGNNAAQFTVLDITAGAQMWYTVDGSNPTNAAPSLGPILSGTTLSLQFQPGQSNLTFKVMAFRDNYKPSAIWINNFSLSDFVPKTTISPNSGYYPMGQTITVSSFNPNVYYTVDGSEPATNSLPVAMTNNVGLIKWFNPTNDLRGLRVKAFNASGASDTVAGQPVTINTIGVPPDCDPAVYAGIGSQIVVPVVANLGTNTTIQSYQFRVEIAPIGGAQPISGFDALSISPNDLVPLATFARAGTVGTIYCQHYTLGSTNGLEIYAIGNTNNVSFLNFAVVALLRITIPYGASEGDSYALAVSYPSATADGVSASVPLTPMAPATILVTNLAYKVGDSASILGGWYNAGGFGNGDLDNADVNPAFYASLGERVPYGFSDVFNAMDAYPVDATGFVGGDGQIRFLDWNVILQRSLRLDTNNWARAWSPGGDLVDVPTTLTAAKAKVMQPKSASPWSWYRQALIGAVSTGNAVAGSTVSVPVYVKLSDGATLSGIQFRVAVTPQGGAPALTQAPQLARAPGVPGPTLQQGFNAGEAGFGWSLGSLTYLSRSSNFLGWVSFTIPATAQSGQTYSVSFAHADGAPNLSVQYDFESKSAVVAVGGSASPASNCSDEWRIHFFGSLANPSAGDLTDADGDGVPNWREYLAGTDPTDPNSRLQLSGVASPAGKAQAQMALHWLTAPGKAYEVQWAANLSGGVWSALATVSGDGTVANCSDTNMTATVRYYRLRVLP